MPALLGGPVSELAWSGRNLPRAIRVAELVADQATSLVSCRLAWSGDAEHL